MPHPRESSPPWPRAEGATWLRIGRLAASWIVLAWLGSAHWPESVDDVYILADFGRTWAHTGQLTWTNGERVEGFSSPALVAIAALGALAQVPPELVLKLLAALSACVTLGVLSFTLPATALGTLALLALAASAPFSYWAVDGMDTPAFSLLLLLGWRSVALGRGQATVGWLSLSTLVRPEGWAHLFLAAAIGARRDRGPRPAAKWVAGPLAALTVVALARVAWFGFALPTPVVVKVLASPFAPGGASQALSDLTPLAGAVVAAALAVRTGPVRWLALAPAAIQGFALLSAGGDWMGHSRLLLPGILGSLGVLASMAPAEARAGASLSAVALTFVGVVAHPTGDGRFALDLRAPPSLEHAAYQYARGLVTPLPEDVAWAVEHVPEGATILTNDVGFIGGVPGIRVLDLHGLATRAVAEAIHDGDLDRWLREALSGPRRPFAVRLAWWGSAPEDPFWLAPPYPTRTDVRYPGGTVSWYADASSLSAPAIADRWRALRRQHPQHAWIAWRAAIAEGAAAGPLAGSAEVSAARELFPSDPRFEPGTGSTSFSTGSVPLEWVSARGFALYWDGFVESPPGPCEPTAVLYLDADAIPAGPATVRVSWRLGSAERAHFIEVAEPASFAAGVLCELGEIGTFRVEFLNDEAGATGDRNVYVRLPPGG